MIKWLLSAAALLVGVGLRLATRPSVDELESLAVASWNRGEVTQAEQMARRALGRSANSAAGRAVLLQVAAHEGQPLLHVAALLSVPANAPDAASARFQAGEVALDAGYAAIAEHAWEEALRLEPGHQPAHSRLVTLAGMRLDREAIARRLRDRAAHCPLTAESMQLLVGAEFLNLQPAALEPTLRSFVEHDPTDAASAIGLCRCLLRLDRAAESRQILENVPPSSARQLLWAHAALVDGDVEAARSALANGAPQSTSGDYWQVAGEVALASGDPAEAITAFARAVALRPLNREFRARYGFALRLGGALVENVEQAEALNHIQQVEETVTSPTVRWDATTVDKLLRHCEAVAATDIVEQLRQFQHSLSTPLAG